MFMRTEFWLQVWEPLMSLNLVQINGILEYLE
jgi:hypothetical protein